MFGACKKPEEYHASQQDSEVSPLDALHRQRSHRGAYAQYPEDVEEIAANDIPYSDVTLTLAGCHDTRG